MSKSINPKDPIFYVYALANPLKDNQYFYIGYSGRKERINEHFLCKKQDGNAEKKNTIREIQKAGLKPTVIKILENVDEYTAIKKEIEMVAYYGRVDKGQGSLTNMTDGGEGGNGGHGRNKLDLSGQVFGRLTAITLHGKNKNNRYMWLCSCECGNEKIVSRSGLRSKDIQSCGCLRRETTTKMKTTHGMTNSTEFRIWTTFKRMCCNPNDQLYKNYGGKGIKVGERWLDSFENFYEDMGKRPSEKYILGRKDVNGDFKSENCRWITRAEQNNNRTTKSVLNISGHEKSVKDWSDISGTNYSTIQSRLNRGWNHEEAVYGKER